MFANTQLLYYCDCVFNTMIWQKYLTEYEKKQERTEREIKKKKKQPNIKDKDRETDIERETETERSESWGQKNRKR